ncbi:hypothetical protein BDV28DRAFT_144297 [Aspergillus coremiiformis]|uniref:Serine/arginine repetitive matrix protein 1 n=1 Tax=Aspergillus coremiiformis TaxID=138285 RepID=A0A5N6YRR9_9EURO|nr:hypothetical protein BDV28DRAFT_144297 [Aspergillus coremiiformis]
MDWDRNRRFDDHRGGESYRPAGSRGYIRRSRSPRNHSPRLVADTWVPSPSRSYGRVRSRSPPSFRARSPSLYNRDSGPGSYMKACSPPRRFSPRREGRPRSPAPISWRIRSPYTESRPRDFSRDRNISKRPRDLSPPNPDFRSSRRERPPLAPSDQYMRQTSPAKRSLLRDNLARAPMIPRSRSPIQEGRRDRYADNSIAQRRRSPSPRGVPSTYTSAPVSVSNSRRSSPFTDNVGISQFDHKARSPASQPIPCRRSSRNSEVSLLLQEHAILSETKPSQDETRYGSPVVDQLSNSGKGPDPDPSGRPPIPEVLGRDLGQSNTTHSASVPSKPRAYGVVQDHVPPSGPSHGPKSLSFQTRGSNISILSAPTRPRGGPSFKENVWAGVPARRGPVSTGVHGPPTGPRSTHMPTGPCVDIHRHPTYRQGNVTGITYPRTPRYMSHLTGLCSIIPGGRSLPSDLDTHTGKRLAQLDADEGRLFEQISDTQRLKRVGIQDWDKLDRESSICALKSELAEGHLQCISDGESAHVSPIF